MFIRCFYFLSSFLYFTTGTAVTDFRQQLEGADAFNLKRYTFVVIELAGWGRSRPPKRPYGLSVYDNDVTCAAKLMEVSEWMWKKPLSKLF